MLNKAVYDALSPELQLLYKMKLPITNKIILKEMRVAVRNLRKKYKSTGFDRLAVKLNRYGNKGGWRIKKNKDL
jgi:hypothetical protein